MNQVSGQFGHYNGLNGICFTQFPNPDHLTSESFGVWRGPFFRIPGFKVMLHTTIRNDDF